MPRIGSLLITALSLLVSSFASAATTSMAPTSELRQALAPTGKLRVGLNLPRSFLVKRDAATGEVTGIAVDLSHMLAERLNVTVELVLYPDVGPIVWATIVCKSKLKDRLPPFPFRPSRDTSSSFRPVLNRFRLY
jgi:ABC-type amino acid transport substrate-binding protein